MLSSLHPTPPALIWPLLGSSAPYPMTDWWSCNTLHAPPQFPGAGDFQGALEGKGRFSGSTGTNWTPLSFACSSDRSVASLLCRLKVWTNRPVASGGRVSLSITAFQHPSPTFLSCGGCLGFVITQYFSGSAHREAAVGSFWALNAKFWVSGPKRFMRNFSCLYF